MENIYKELEQYFKNTPREKILSDWNKSESFDKIGPTVDEYFSSKEYIVAQLRKDANLNVDITINSLNKLLNYKKEISIEILKDIDNELTFKAGKELIDKTNIEITKLLNSI